MIAKLLPFVALLCMTTGVHAQLMEHSRRESTTNYQVFELPEADEWIGESETVKYEPPAAASGSWRAIEYASATINIVDQSTLADDIKLFDAVTITDDDWQHIPRIQLLSLNQQVGSDAQANVREANEETSAGMSRNRSEPAEIPVYANIVNESGTLLANSQAYSLLDGTANETTLEAKGRVGSYADIRSSLSSTESFAEATATSKVVAEYRFNHEFDFILDTTLSTMLAEDGYSFRLRDLASDTDLIDFQPDDGQSHRLELCGTLAPGNYELTVEAASSAATYAAGDPDLGGLGEFDLYFRAFDPKRVIEIDIDFVKTEDVWWSNEETTLPTIDRSWIQGGWKSIEFWTGNGIGETGVVLSDAVSTDAATVASVPEPHKHHILILCLAFFAWHRKQRKF